MYEHSRERIWRERARSYTTRLLPVARWTGSHDLGFIIGSPATLGLRLDPSAARGLAYATAIREASRSLSARWNSRVGAIRSSFYDGRCGLIIDSAMNAPMLIETGLVYGGGEGRRLATRGTEHLRTLVRHFIRADGSTRHRLAFDPRTGAPTGPLYGQGLSADSTWSRGQAWAINGFARGHLLTGDPQLLDAARRTADFWISRVPAGCVPAWDLDVASDSAPRDSSAAAITADGLLTLSLVEPDAERAAAYRDYALTTLGTLAAPAWVPDRGRGLLARQSYNVPADPREGTYAWGDTYLLSALATVASTRQSSG
jgi:unsaturated chondroitin disaccharide hydrolase